MKRWILVLSSVPTPDGLPHQGWRAKCFPSQGVLRLSSGLSRLTGYPDLFFSLFWLCGLFFADVRPRCAVALPEMVFSLARIAVLHQSASHTSSLAALNLSVRIFSGWAAVFLNLLSHSFFLISSRLFLPPTDKLSSPTSEDRILQVWSQMNHHVINGVTTGVGLRNRNWQIDE